ncbi:MAG: Kdo hydroxylase family protein [Alphaproteobacteria bacterium]|nr:Kdo hydroxylase family protein [Alphaproteobacteria bacterium]
MTRHERDIGEILETLDVIAWDGPVLTNMSGSPVDALEDGKVLYLPRLGFGLSAGETRFLSPAMADAAAKNVSYHPPSDALKHALGSAEDLAAMKAMLRRYHEHALALVRLLLPQYADSLEIGRTSFRPAEIAGRRLSAKRDDTRLHVDAFPSAPTGGKRILRVFTNVNPDGKGRDWRLGERFEEVALAFSGKLPPYSRARARFLNTIGATKAFRTAYDHTMLNIHDRMKADDEYQRAAEQNAFSFPPGSTWIVYTDRVSHAAMAGQHLFEQTFYLPVKAMADPARAPLRILERVMGRALA